MAGDILLNILRDPFAIVLVVVFFGASIFIHELGHFLVARWRGLKIERFSIGFGPRLFGWTDKHGVDWRVSALPLGGYVALPQLADMRGAEGASRYRPEDLPPISYTDKVYVAVAGAVFNIIFAFALACILWMTGLPVSRDMVHTVVGQVSETIQISDEVTVPGPAWTAGIRPGDRILAVDGEQVHDFEDLTYALTTSARRTQDGQPLAVLTVEQQGVVRDLEVLPVRDAQEGLRLIGIQPALPPLVLGTLPNSPAALAGIQPGDLFTHVDGQPLAGAGQLADHIAAHPDQVLELTIARGSETVSVRLRPEMVTYTEGGKQTPMIGVQWDVLTLSQRGPFTQIADSVTTTFRVLGALLHPKSDVGLSNLSGPVGISYTLYIFSQIGILQLLSLVVLINVNLAILNLMPIPVLDGGHIAFATFEKLRGRPLPGRLISALQGGVVVLLLGVMIYVSFFDVNRVARNEADRLRAEEAPDPQIPVQFTGESMRDLLPPPAEG